MTDSAITFDIDSPAVARRFQSLLNAYYVSSRLSEEPSAVPADLFATVYTLSRTGRQEGMSRALLKLSGSLVHDYATISDDSPSPNRASRARRAATSAGIS